MASQAVPSMRVSDIYPPELHGIRTLFLQQQYRHCTRACREAMRTMDSNQSQPLQRSFVLFYLGLAHDELAHTMHQSSQAKLPAFSSAEHFYREALEALPSPAEVHELCNRLAAQHQRDVQSPGIVDTDFTTGALLRSRPVKMPRLEASSSLSSAMTSPSVSNVHKSRSDSLFSPQSSRTFTSSPGHEDDLVSHDSFDDIMTPSPILRRDFSRMSLLDTTHHHAPMARNISSHNIMHSVMELHSDSALDSRVRPVLPLEGQSTRPSSRPDGTHRNSRLPRLATEERTLPAILASSNHDAYPGNSPISPLGSDVNFSESSAVSPISLRPIESPDASRQVSQTPYSSPPQVESAEKDDISKVIRHIDAARVQFQSHIAMVQQSKERLVRLRTNVSSLQGQSASNNFLKHNKTSESASRIGDVGVSITPQAAHTEQRQPPQRAWAKGRRQVRFQPERYAALAEIALAELLS